MKQEIENKKLQKVRNIRAHLANERTFLAWIRTSISIMAFGFVVEKFGLFISQISYFLGKEGVYPPPRYSSFLGIFLVALGAIIGVLSFVRYKKVEKDIDEEVYHPSLTLDILLTLSLLAIGIFLIIYLIHSI